jgi:hypothetical protein
MGYETMSDEEYGRELIARGDSDKGADEAFERLYNENHKK